MTKKHHTSSGIGLMIGMTFLAAIFWVIGLIPIVNIVSGIIFGLIFYSVFLITKSKQFKDDPNLLYKCLALSLPCFLLSLIPIISWFPWTFLSTIGTFWISR